MKIGIFLHPYGEKNPAGLARGILEITRALVTEGQQNEYIIFIKNGQKLLPEFPGGNWKIKIVRKGLAWRDRALRGEKLDAYIFNTPVLPFFKKPGRTMVITHDFAYLRFSPSLFLKIVHLYALKRADIIMAASEYAKNEIMQVFGINESKIKVIYQGYNDICRLSRDIPMELPEKFFIFVGAIKERKNVLGVVEAFSVFKRKTQAPHKLILTGHRAGNYYAKIKERICERALENEVLFSGSVSDERLASLYKNAEALLYPSFIEGFGFPLLEAMSCGLPVITSNVSSLPEVAGGAALTVDPQNPTEIAGAMEKLVGDPILRSELAKKGYERVKNFSWAKTAKEIIGYLIQHPA